MKAKESITILLQHTSQSTHLQHSCTNLERHKNLRLYYSNTPLNGLIVSILVPMKAKESITILLQHTSQSTHLQHSCTNLERHKNLRLYYSNTPLNGLIVSILVPMKAKESITILLQHTSQSTHLQHSCTNLERHKNLRLYYSNTPLNGLIVSILVPMKAKESITILPQHTSQ